jgi:hypothetical protein
MQEIPGAVADLRAALPPILSDITSLQGTAAAFKELYDAFKGLYTAVEDVRVDVGAIRTWMKEVHPNLRSPDAEVRLLSGELAQMRAELTTLKDRSGGVSRTPTAPGSPARVPASPPLFAKFESLILSGIPPLLAEFRRKRFQLLWRGSRDGFGAADFHQRCDGRGNTLVVVLDSRGSVFGGFTPVTWDSSGLEKADGSGRSFLFAMREGSNTGPKRFGIKPEAKNRAISCRGDMGPCFHVDLFIGDQCNTGSVSGGGGPGTIYTEEGAPTGTDISLFPQSTTFTVREIEVFEIMN